MENTDFKKFQVLGKFTENSSSACYQVTSAGKWQLEATAKYSGECFLQIRKRFDESAFQKSLGPVSSSKEALCTCYWPKFKPLLQELIHQPPICSAPPYFLSLSELEVIFKMLGEKQ